MQTLLKIIQLSQIVLMLITAISFVTSITYTIIGLDNFYSLITAVVSFGLFVLLVVLSAIIHSKIHNDYEK